MIGTRACAVIAAGLFAATTLAGCGSEQGDAREQVTEAVLLPQSLFPGGGAVTACPSLPEDAAKDTTGNVPKAVCITVENSGDTRAAFTVNVDVRTRDEDDLVVVSQVVLTTPPIEPGATGSVAVAAPGAERVIDEFAEGQKDAQKAAGLIEADDVALQVTAIQSTPA